MDRIDRLGYYVDDASTRAGARRILSTANGRPSTEYPCVLPGTNSNNQDSPEVSQPGVQFLPLPRALDERVVNNPPRSYVHRYHAHSDRAHLVRTTRARTFLQGERDRERFAVRGVP